MKTKDLVISAMFTTIITMFLFLDTRFAASFFIQYFGFVIPVFIAMLFLQENEQVAYITCIASTLLSLILGTTLLSISYVITAFLLGIIIGKLMNSKLSSNKIFYIATVVSLGFTILQYYIYAFWLQLPTNPVSEFMEILSIVNLQVSYEFLLLGAITMMFAFSVLQTVLIFVLLRYIAIRFNYKWRTISFSTFRSNKIMATITIIYFFVALNLNSFHANDMITLVNIIIMAIFLVMHAVIGVSIGIYLLRRFQKTKWISILPILMCIPPILNAFIFLGIIDGFIDVRKKIKEL